LGLFSSARSWFDGNDREVARLRRNVGRINELEPAMQKLSDAELAAWMLGDGTYVTDGATLFRVAHAMPDRSRGELLVELEDCRTLELILCSSRALANLHLATVTPAEVIRSG